MANVALGKPIEEPIANPTAVTDGVAIGYTAHEGFAHFEWPGTVTVDLGTETLIECIRVLLWDGRGRGGVRAGRAYKYRVLTSGDHQAWSVLFDDPSLATNGWQEFQMASPMPMRFIRIHGLWNSANESFHIVEIEAHDALPPPLEAEIVVKRVVGHSPSIEHGDGSPIEARLRGLLDGIDKLVEESGVLKPEPFRDLTSRLRLQVADVAALEQSVDAVRREIVGPVQEELRLANKAGRFSFWGFWVGLIGGILAIVSMWITLANRN